MRRLLQELFCFKADNDAILSFRFCNDCISLLFFPELAFLMVCEQRVAVNLFFKGNLPIILRFKCSDLSFPVNNNLQLIRCVTGAGTRDVAIANTAACTGGFRVLANNVSTVDFPNPVTSAVTITLQIRYRNPRLPGTGQVTFPLSSRVRLRNT